MTVQFFRLWPRRPQDGSLPLGLSCDDEGLLLAGNCRLIEACLDRDGHLFYRARPVSELNALLGAGYGAPVDCSDLYRSIEEIAEHMTRRKWTAATLGAVNLRLPELPDATAAQRVLDADRLLKVWNPALHPRWPAHSDEEHGGQFRPSDGSSVSTIPVAGRGSGSGGRGGRGGRGGSGAPAQGFGEMLGQILRRLFRIPPKAPEPPGKPGPPQPPLQSKPGPPTPEPGPPSDKPPGIGHNQPPEPIETEPSQPLAPPKAPQLPPTASGKDVYRWGRRVADAIGEAARNADAETVRKIADAVDAARNWLYTQYEKIVASLDPPKSYEELVRDAEEKGGGSGYEVHHIVEQWKKESGEFSESEIEDRSNRVRIPYYQHKMIQSFYQRRNPDLGGQTPRQFLKGKSFGEQLEYGKGVLRKFGVMK